MEMLVCMNIENEIFKKSVIAYDKLIPYGFKRKDGQYMMSKNILNDSFRIDIEISDIGIVKGKIIDLSLNEEYTNYRVVNQTGKFVNNIRKEFEKILMDIRDHCTTTNYFLTNQANRITNLIIKKYNDIPEFAWNKFPEYGIFRNSNNDKWYGLIMNINRGKIDKGSEEVEILNVKLDEEEIKILLNRKGFYKAYHMNKENWITILLDDTIKDEEIMTYIVKSHKFTEQIEEWLIPANPKYYDVINCFNETDTILWKQSNNIKNGDFVYLYVAIPYSSILYKCKVLEVNIPYEYQDKNVSMSKVMKIKLLAKYNKNKFTFEKIKKYGIKAIRGPRSMPKELSIEINKLSK